MLTKDLFFGVNILSWADFLLYGFTAMIAHFVMSLGQTLFHRYLGHSRLGRRFFKNHIQFHHTHYSGDHVVSTNYLDNGDNNSDFNVDKANSACDNRRVARELFQWPRNSTIRPFKTTIWPASG